MSKKILALSLLSTSLLANSVTATASVPFSFSGSSSFSNTLRPLDSQNAWLRAVNNAFQMNSNPDPTNPIDLSDSNSNSKLLFDEFCSLLINVSNLFVSTQAFRIPNSSLIFAYDDIETLRIDDRLNDYWLIRSYILEIYSSLDNNPDEIFTKYKPVIDSLIRNLRDIQNHLNSISPNVPKIEDIILRKCAQLEISAFSDKF